MSTARLALPRFARRRRAPHGRGRVRRPPRIPLRWAVLAALTAALLAGGYLWLRDSSFVAVEEVSITGLTGPDAAAVRSALTATAKDMTTLNFDTGQLEDAVAAYPIVKSVTATTDGLHGVRIVVAEHVPVAVVDDAGARTPVAADGTLLRRGVLRSGLPLITADAPAAAGQRLAAGAARMALAVAATAPPALRPLIAEVGPGPQGLQAKVASGPVIVFGSTRGVRAKWAAAARILADPNARGAGYLDVSVPERPVAGRFAPGPGVATTDSADQGLPTADAAAVDATDATGGTDGGAAVDGTDDAAAAGEAGLTDGSEGSTGGESTSTGGDVVPAE